MPRFYFHLVDEWGRHPDEIGVELPDLEAAYMEAFETARALWKESLDKRREPRGSRFEIANVDGHLLLDLPFSEILHAATRERPIRPVGSAAKARDIARKTIGLTEALQKEIDVARERVQAARELLNEPSRWSRGHKV